MFYELAKKALFATDPETAHYLSMESLRRAHQLGATRLLCSHHDLPVQCMGLEFANPVGIAPGLDKNADYFEALGALGFGFVEVGTVTPRPQDGNPKPRVFRIPQASALINRLGFNNKGVEHLVQQVKKRRYDGVLGINIGKNATTPNDKAADDYLHCLQQVYPYADYITVNISSPNTKNLRDLQAEGSLAALLTALTRERQVLHKKHGRLVPLALKIAPDLDPAGLEAVARTVEQNEIEAVIASNTTITRPGLDGLEHASESGGLSGAPLKPLADQALAGLRDLLPPETSLIGVGGICKGQDAVDKLDKGASLVQFYTGMIYRGPGLLSECLQAIAQRPAT
ncbi:MAG TPA: quinone-dependent dihydroorotate dehydrogenase [Xanthomonadales bacterium]|nr:quinone-dependent dihydroorotate dehydrogenase [Xanthomonadales bacterium]